MHVIRTLKIEGYSQSELDYLFETLVISTISYGLSVYGSSTVELGTVQRFLDRCYRRNYISQPVHIRNILEKQDRNIFKASMAENSLLFDLMPKRKCTTYSLRTDSSNHPNLNTERYKLSFVNRLIFNYNLFIKCNF